MVCAWKFEKCTEKEEEDELKKEVHALVQWYYTATAIALVCLCGQLAGRVFFQGLSHRLNDDDVYGSSTHTTQAAKEELPIEREREIADDGMLCPKAQAAANKTGTEK